MNKTAKNSAIYLFGTIVMAVVSFISTMVLTRVLEQKVYALYGLHSTFATVSMMVISLGNASAYTRFYYNHGYTQKGFLLKVLKLPMILFPIFTILVLEPTHTIINYVFKSELSYIAIFIFLAYILFTLLHRFTQITVRMEEHAWNYILSNIFAKAGFVVVVVVAYLIFRKVSFEMVLLSFAIAAIFSVLINLPVVIKVANEEKKADQKVRGKDIYSYGVPYMMNEALILVIPLIEKVIVRDLAGWEVLSVFTAASIFQTVASMISQTVVNVWNPIVFKNCDNPDKLKPIIHNFGLAATVLFMIGTAFLIILRRWLVLILDASYYEVYIIAPAMFFGALFNISSYIYGCGITIKKKTLHLVAIPIIQLFITVAICYIAIPKIGLAGVGLASIAGIVVSRIYRFVVGMKLYSTGENESVTILLYTIASLIVISAMFFISFTADIILGTGLIAVTLILTGGKLKALYKEVSLFIVKK